MRNGIRFSWPKSYIYSIRDNATQDTKVSAASIGENTGKSFFESGAYLTIIMVVSVHVEFRQHWVWELGKNILESWDGNQHVSSMNWHGDGPAVIKYL